MARGEALGQAIADESRSAVDGYVREEARQMLQRALECEVDAFLAEYAARADKHGRSIEELIPWLCLKGVSTGDYPEALQALLGQDAK